MYNHLNSSHIQYVYNLSFMKYLLVMVKVKYKENFMMVAAFPVNTLENEAMS